MVLSKQAACIPDNLVLWLLFLLPLLLGVVLTAVVDAPPVSTSTFLLPLRAVPLFAPTSVEPAGVTTSSVSLGFCFLLVDLRGAMIIVLLLVK